jgi:hypothetical protein
MTRAKAQNPGEDAQLVRDDGALPDAPGGDIDARAGPRPRASSPSASVVTDHDRQLVLVVASGLAEGAFVRFRGMREIAGTRGSTSGVGQHRRHR